MALKTVKKSRRISSVIIPCIIAAFVMASIITGSLLSRHEIEYYDFQKDVASGIDVSEHNGEIDWQTVSENVDFAFIRVGYRGYGTGEIIEDKCAKENLKGAKKAKIPFGVYFYSQAVNEKEARQEADFAVKAARRYNPVLPIIIDFEYPTDAEGERTGRLHAAGLSAEENTAIINAFCEEVRDKGYPFGVYASSSVLKHSIETKNLLSDTAVWAADYNSEMRYEVKHKIRQYSRTGSCDGVSSKNVDLNYYYKKTQKG